VLINFISDLLISIAKDIIFVFLPPEISAALLANFKKPSQNETGEAGGTVSHMPTLGKNSLQTSLFCIAGVHFGLSFCEKSSG
jgi:hypothetical protein